MLNILRLHTEKLYGKFFVVFLEKQCLIPICQNRTALDSHFFTRLKFTVTIRNTISLHKLSINCYNGTQC